MHGQNIGGTGGREGWGYWDKLVKVEYCRIFWDETLKLFLNNSVFFYDDVEITTNYWYMKYFLYFQSSTYIIKNGWQIWNKSCQL